MMKNMTTKALALIALSLMSVACTKTTNEQASIITPQDYRARHPILVSPSRAYLPHKCGQWEEDLGANSVSAKLNEPHWNHGCTTQNNMAAMIANPHDLVEMRPKGQSDGARAAVYLDKHRRGQDTTTSWKSEDKNRTQVK